MKNLLFLLLIPFGSYIAVAQTNTPKESCYEQWAKVFDARGAYEIPEGEQSEIIIAIRRNSGNYECFVGKVKVEGKVVTKLYRQLVDGSYEIFEPESKFKNFKMEIVNGITNAMQTVDSEVIYIIFYKYLKPKKMDYQVAPLPDSDDF